MIPCRKTVSESLTLRLDFEEDRDASPISLLVEKEREISSPRFALELGTLKDWEAVTMIPPPHARTNTPIEANPNAPYTARIDRSQRRGNSSTIKLSKIEKAPTNKATPPRMN